MQLILWAYEPFFTKTLQKSSVKITVKPCSVEVFHNVIYQFPYQKATFRLCVSPEPSKSGLSQRSLIQLTFVSHFLLSLSSGQDERDAESKEVIEDQLVNLVTRDFIDCFSEYKQKL